jgi:hypothetical protein
MPELDTYNRYLSDLDPLARCLARVKKETGSLAIPVWKARDVEVPEDVTDRLGDAVSGGEGVCGVMG